MARPKKPYKPKTTITIDVETKDNLGTHRLAEDEPWNSILKRTLEKVKEYEEWKAEQKAAKIPK